MGMSMEVGAGILAALSVLFFFLGMREAFKKGIAPNDEFGFMGIFVTIILVMWLLYCLVEYIVTRL